MAKSQSFERMFEDLPRLIQLILLLIPGVNWVTEVLVRWSHALRTEGLIKYVMAIVVTLFGIVTELKMLQLKKASFPIFVTPSGISKLSRLRQFANIFSEITDIPFSKLTRSSEIQPSKTDASASPIAPFTVTSFNEIQFFSIFHGSFVTPAGTVKLSNALQS